MSRHRCKICGKLSDGGMIHYGKHGWYHLDCVFEAYFDTLKNTTSEKQEPGEDTARKIVVRCVKNALREIDHALAHCEDDRFDRVEQDIMEAESFLADVLVIIEDEI